MIHAVYIVKDGICLFSRQYCEKKIDSNLFSSFLTALNLFAKEISNKNLKQILIEDDIFTFSIIDDLIFVYNHDKIKDSKLERISNKLSAKFFELFQQELKNWDGEVSRFKKFKKEADEILAMKGESILIEMEKFLQEKKTEAISKKKTKEMKGESILIEMEKFLRGEKKTSKKDSS